VTLKGQGHDPSTLRAQYLNNGCRYILGCNGAPKEMTTLESNTIRYDTIEEINVDSKAEYTA